MCGPCLPEVTDVGSFGLSHLSLTLGLCALDQPTPQPLPGLQPLCSVCGGWGRMGCVVLYNRCSPSLDPLALGRKTQALVLTFMLLLSPPASSEAHPDKVLHSAASSPATLFSRARDHHTAIDSHRPRLPLQPPHLRYALRTKCHLTPLFVKTQCPSSSRSKLTSSFF